MRLVEMNKDALTFDFNHPMARYPVAIDLVIGEIGHASDEHGGRCHDIIEDLANGPGIQARWDDRPSDFLGDTPFSRLDDNLDALFYAMPRLLDHLDGVALDQVARLYQRLLPPHANLLDLMASGNSHLYAALAPSGVTGLGMNARELEANPILTRRVVQDLNRDPRLPFADAEFDAVICTVSVEYLTDPAAVFAEVARVLRPAGRCVVTFSNRWFPPKVVNIWQDLHKFERSALVLEYFLSSGRFVDPHTRSVRGLMRPEDDRHIQYSRFSDPLHAVWGSRAE
jgi:SAM-dependent methyltransferase